jgi:hypothetical protein
MKELYRGSHWPGYYQFVLLDAEDPEHPQWPTGEEIAVGGPKGVAVTTGVGPKESSGGLVELIVYAAPGRPPGVLRFEQDLIVGSEGLLIGDAEGAYATIPWPAGKTHVSVYTNSEDRYPFQGVTCVAFVLEPA